MGPAIEQSTGASAKDADDGKTSLEWRTSVSMDMPVGLGDTPVALTLQYLKQSGLSFPADIELEYPVPEDSDAARKVAKCVEFCRQALAQYC